MRYVASQNGTDWDEEPDWQSYEASVPVEIGVSGTWYYKVEFRDEADNRLELIDSVIVDADAPARVASARLSALTEALLERMELDPELRRPLPLADDPQARRLWPPGTSSPSGVQQSPRQGADPVEKLD